MQKILSTLLFLCVSAIQIHANRINHYGPAREIFVFALDSFVKHRSEQGIEKMTEQMLKLRKKDDSISLDGRTTRHIDYVHERYRKANDEDAVCFMAPFLFASGTSFIAALGYTRESYEWATKKDTKPDAGYIAMRRSQMEDSQWDMDVALKGRRIITQDVMRIKRKHLKESFPHIQEDIQAKILEEAEASFCSDCRKKPDRYSFENRACEDFYEKLIIMREAHKASKEKNAAELAPKDTDTATMEIEATQDSAVNDDNSTTQQSND